MLNGERVTGEEVRFERKDGTSFVALVSASPLSETARGGALATIQDISQIIEAERAREEFVSMVRHEIANPLTVIMGSAARGQRRAKQLDADAVGKVFADIADHAGIIRSLLENLGEYSRFETGKFELSPEWTSVRDLLEEVERTFDDLT